MKQIAIIDDHKLFAAGLELLLEDLPGGVKNVSFDNPAAFLKAVRQDAFAPDLITLDFYIPGHNAIEVISDIRQVCPDTPILVISGSISSADKASSLSSGANSYVYKHTNPELLLGIVSNLLEGLPPEADASPSHSVALDINLTTRQIEILTLAAKGCSNKEIARMLEISPETVKSHLASIYQRFSVNNRVEAIEAARSAGLA